MTTEILTLGSIAVAIGYGLHKNRRYFLGIGLTDQEIEMRNEYNALKDRIDATIRFNQVHQLEQDIAHFAKKYESNVDTMLAQKFWTTLIKRAEHRKRKLLPTTYGGFF